MATPDEVGWIARIEAADGDALAALLLDATDDEADAHQRYFGAALHVRLLSLAARQRAALGTGVPRRPLLVVPGLFGSRLSVEEDGRQVPAWPPGPAPGGNGFRRLLLDPSGRAPAEPADAAAASGVLMRAYGELVLTLAARFEVHPFPYDWRTDLEDAARELTAFVGRLRTVGEPPGIVAHASGGLVARWFLAQQEGRRGGTGRPASGGRPASRLLTLGTPQHGTFAAPLQLAGLPALLRNPGGAQADKDGRAVTASFPALYQLLPDPALLAATQPELGDALYDPASYGGLEQYAHHLEHARRSHERLAASAAARDPDTLVSVVGYGRPTPVGIRDVAALRTGGGGVRLEQVATMGLDGDGVVLLDLAELGTPTLCLNASHGGLTSDPRLVGLLEALVTVDARAVATLATGGILAERPSLADYAGLALPTRGRAGSRPAQATAAPVTAFDEAATALWTGPADAEAPVFGETERASDQSPPVASPASPRRLSLAADAPDAAPAAPARRRTRRRRRPAPLTLESDIAQLPEGVRFDNVVGEPRPHLRLEEITRFLRVAEAREVFAVSGAGQTVAVIDSGLNVAHPDFSGKVVARRNFIGTITDPEDVTDRDGHGTHVTGLIVANGRNVGIAPGADVAPLRIFLSTGELPTWEAGLIPALEWVIAHHQDHRITAVNCSIADGNWERVGDYTDRSAAQRLTALLRQLREVRIPVVVSAGNRYPGKQGMGFPAIVPGCVSVGAVFDADIGPFRFGRFLARTTAAGRVTPFTQRLHESVNADAFTTVFAPGSRATSSGIRGDNFSIDRHGTSQAAPVTTGVVLLMQELHRTRHGELPAVNDLTSWLRAGSEDIVDGDDEDDDVVHTQCIFRRIDAVKALEAVR